MARILVTGGAGFIGGHLMQKLLDEGHTPVVIDNLSTGFKENIPEGVTAYFEDCRDTDALKIAAQSCEFVYHLASTVGVEKVLKDPQACIKNVIESTQSVLNLGIPGMDFSTSEVYGKNLSILSEDSDLVYSSKARWSYAVSKLITEWLVKAAGWKTVRLFNIVGPRQSLGYVFSNFIRQARENRDLRVYGSGSQIRTFLDVRDAVDILSQLREKTFDVVNVGGKHTMTVDCLAETIKTVTKSDSRIVHVPYRDAYSEGFETSFEDCQARIPDLTRLHGLIGDYKYRPLEQTMEDSW